MRWDDETAGGQPGTVATAPDHEQVGTVRRNRIQFVMAAVLAALVVVAAVTALAVTNDDGGTDVASPAVDGDGSGFPTDEFVDPLGEAPRGDVLPGETFTDDLDGMSGETVEVSEEDKSSPTNPAAQPLSPPPTSTGDDETFDLTGDNVEPRPPAGAENIDISANIVGGSVGADGRVIVHVEARNTGSRYAVAKLERVRFTLSGPHGAPVSGSLALGFALSVSAGDTWVGDVPVNLGALAMLIEGDLPDALPAGGYSADVSLDVAGIAPRNFSGSLVLLEDLDLAGYAGNSCYDLFGPDFPQVEVCFT